LESRLSVKLSASVFNNGANLLHHGGTDQIPDGWGRIHSALRRSAADDQFAHFRRKLLGLKIGDRHQPQAAQLQQLFDLCE